MSAPFTIVKVAWLTQLPGNEARCEQIIEHVYRVTKFLQDNALLKRPLIRDRGDVGEQFSISSDDLTESGLTLMKSAYDKWLSKVDNGMNPADVTILERALKRMG